MATTDKDLSEENNKGATNRVNKENKKPKIDIYSTLTYKPRREQRNVLTRMQNELCDGPFSILYRSLDENLRIRVYTRSYNHVRGVCTGYLVAYDKHWNLAMIDVDEVYRNPRCLQPVGREKRKRKKKKTSEPDVNQPSSETATNLDVQQADQIQEKLKELRLKENYKQDEPSENMDCNRHTGDGSGTSRQQISQNDDLIESKDLNSLESEQARLYALLQELSDSNDSIDSQSDSQEGSARNKSQEKRDSKHGEKHKGRTISTRKSSQSKKRVSLSEKTPHTTTKSHSKRQSSGGSKNESKRSDHQSRSGSRRSQRHSSKHHDERKTSKSAERSTHRSRTESSRDQSLNRNVGSKTSRSSEERKSSRGKSSKSSIEHKSDRSKSSKLSSERSRTSKSPEERKSNECLQRSSRSKDHSAGGKQSKDGSQKQDRSQFHEKKLADSSGQKSVKMKDSMDKTGAPSPIRGILAAYPRKENCQNNGQPEVLERHVNQLFIRGDNVVMVALVE